MPEDPLCSRAADFLSPSDSAVRARQRLAKIGLVLLVRRKESDFADRI